MNSPTSGVASGSLPSTGIKVEQINVSQQLQSLSFQQQQQQQPQRTPAMDSHAALLEVSQRYVKL
jgi:hypothetical protein